MASSSPTRRVLYWVGGLLAVLLLAGAAGRWMGWFGGGPGGVSVEVATAERRALTQVVTAFGRAQPEVEVTISPDVSGEIIRLPVKEGDDVEEGDLLVELNQENYRAQVEQQRAAVSQAKANLSQRRADSLQARLNFDRQKKLYEKNVISESDFETARSQYQQAVARLEAARFQVESAEASLRDARERLGQTRIYAPMTGTISKLNVEVGERVVGTAQMAGTEIMTIARLDQMELEVDVNENDVVNVGLADSAQVEIDAYPDRAFRGRVTEIANSARVSNQGTQEQVTNFPVKVRVLDAPNAQTQMVASSDESGVTRPEVPTGPRALPMLRPGMSGTVEIYTETVKDAVAVPIQAVTVRDFNRVRRDSAKKARSGSDGSGSDGSGSDGSGASSGETSEDLRKVVFVAAADTARMVEVTTGISDETHIEIRSGLSGGERVIVGPYSAVSRELSPGARIRIGSGRSGGDGTLASL